MNVHWVPPPHGTLKVNIHAAIFDHPMPNGNISGIGLVLRSSNGNLVNCIAGTIPNLTPLATHLWAMHVGLRRAYIEGVSKTDSVATFGAIKFAHLNNLP